MSLWARLKGNMVKWWQLKVLPILRIDNNNAWGQAGAPQGMDPQAQMQMQQQMQMQAQMQQQMQMQQQGMTPQMQQGAGFQGQETTSIAEPKAQSAATGTNTASGVSGMDAADALEVMNRINREREEKRMKDLAEAQKKANADKDKADEQARLDAILNSTKVDVSAFIQAGKEAAQEQKSEMPAQPEQPAASDDALARAQEIMDRLNREAAADEAKKLAEIEAAKQQAQETFGN